MIGIIYKFTIVCGKFNKEHMPFYIGQHWEKKSIEHFLSKKFDGYIGSGSIWYDYISKLKSEYGRIRWRHFIKREVLYSKDGITQAALDALEKHFIKKFKAHYSCGMGGCNVLIGTANSFGSGSPAKDPIVKKKISDFRKEYYKTKEGKLVKKKLSERFGGETFKGDKNPNYGNYWTEEQKEAMRNKMIGRYNGDKNPNYGNHWSDAQRKRMSEQQRNKYKTAEVNPNPMFGKKRITNGIINTIISSDQPLPDGFWYGMKPQKSNNRKGSTGRIWITNGTKSKMISSGSVIPEGWRKGHHNFL